VRVSINCSLTISMPLYMLPDVSIQNVTFFSRTSPKIVGTPLGSTNVADIVLLVVFNWKRKHTHWNIFKRPFMNWFYSFKCHVSGNTKNTYINCIRVCFNGNKYIPKILYGTSYMYIVYACNTINNIDTLVNKTKYDHIQTRYNIPKHYFWIRYPNYKLLPLHITIWVCSTKFQLKSYLFTLVNTESTCLQGSHYKPEVYADTFSLRPLSGLSKLWHLERVGR